MSRAEYVMLMFVVFSILTISYANQSSANCVTTPVTGPSSTGSTGGNAGSCGGTSNTQNTVNTIIRPFPDPGSIYQKLLGSQTNCGAVDFGCQATKGVAQATAAIAAGIGYPGYILADVVNRIASFGSLVNTLFGAPLGAAGTIPFAALFVVGVGLFIIFEAMRIFRGSSSGI